MSNSAIYSQTRKGREEGLTPPLSSVKTIALNMAPSTCLRGCNQDGLDSKRPREITDRTIYPPQPPCAEGGERNMSEPRALEDERNKG